MYTISHIILYNSGFWYKLRRSAIDKYSTVALWPVKKSARAQNRVDNRYVDIKFMNENDKRQIWGQIFFTLLVIYLTCFNAINFVFLLLLFLIEKLKSWWVFPFKTLFEPKKNPPAAGRGTQDCCFHSWTQYRLHFRLLSFSFINSISSAFSNRREKKRARTEEYLSIADRLTGGNL